MKGYPIPVGKKLEKRRILNNKIHYFSDTGISK
jgi:hypothetical protein